ncbi:hypothetical protein ACF1BE_19655 [Streptomyces sp. NPDC014991]|uniref:hypothetical protein n=1 Tax=Streptomyces sp. NPDC014991 TaxID=3364935 RepID=UPI003700CDC1
MSARDEVHAALRRAGYGVPGADRLLDRVEAAAVAYAAGRPVNETLLKAREAAADLFESEAGERRPMWRVVITDSESPTGIAPVCTATGDNDEHAKFDHIGRPMRDVEGVYGCCPDPVVETYSTVLAAYLVELLNADTEVSGKSSRAAADATHEPAQAGGAQ